MQAYFLSDVHLRNLKDTRSQRNRETLLRFLRFLQMQTQITHLILLGDIFDLWVGSSSVFYRKYKDVVDAIVQLKQNRNIQIIYIEGNHDMHFKKFWTRHGVEVHVDPQYLQLGPWKVRIEHGDLMNPEDTKYLKYREQIRHPRIQRLAQILPGALIDYIGTKASQESRKYSQIQRDEQRLELIAKIRRYAQQAWLKQPFDYFLAGHMHLTDEFQWSVPTIMSSTNLVTAINTGSWLDKPLSLLLTNEGHQWIDIESRIANN